MPVILEKDGWAGEHTSCDGGIESQLDHALVAKGGRDPGWRAHEAGQLGTLDLLQARDDLDGAGAVADDADPLVAEVVAGMVWHGLVGRSLVDDAEGRSPCVPVSGVHHLPLERVETGNVGPGNVVELAPSGDEHIGRVLKRLSGRQVSDLDTPGADQ